MLMSLVFFDLTETIEFLCRWASTIIAGDREMPLVLDKRRLATKVRRRSHALRLVHGSRWQVVQTDRSGLICLWDSELILDCEQLIFICRSIDQRPQMRTAKHRCADAASLIAAAASAQEFED